MMADLMHEDVRYNRSKLFPVFCPVIEDRPPVEKYRVGHHATRWRSGALSETYALEKAEQVKFAVGA